MTANKITMKHRAESSRYVVDIKIDGKPAVVTSHRFTFADPEMNTERTLLSYDELSIVLDVVDSYKRSRFWAER